MNQSEFGANLPREGYQVYCGGMRANETNAKQSHGWDARVIVIGGEIAIARNGRTFHEGDSCAVAAGEMHAEQIGPRGVAYIAGCRAI